MDFLVRKSFMEAFDKEFKDFDDGLYNIFLQPFDFPSDSLDDYKELVNEFKYAILDEMEERIKYYEENTDDNALGSEVSLGEFC